MRLSGEGKDARIVELYKSGWSFRQLQERYHKSPNYIAKLVKGIEVTCSACGKPKGKVRFHAHHPDRLNRPDYTIPLCPSCHAKEEARLRREKESQSQLPLNQIVSTTEKMVRKTNTGSLKPPLVLLSPIENIDSKPSTVPFSFSLVPLSPTKKKVLTGLGIVACLETASPGFLERRWKEIKDHWKKA
jgi:hypothetical protein